MKLVKVVYNDLTEQDGVEKPESLNMKTIEIFGYLLEDKDVIRVIKEYDWDKTEHQVIVIPRSVILKIIELKEAKNETNKRKKNYSK